MVEVAANSSSPLCSLLAWGVWSVSVRVKAENEML